MFVKYSNLLFIVKLLELFRNEFIRQTFGNITAEICLVQ